MKKILTHLTGIACIIAILLAGACSPGEKQEETTPVPEKLAAEGNDSTTVKVYLREIEIGGSMHLLMSDSRKSDVEVIDGLITYVNRGDTVNFVKGQNSKIRSVEEVRLLGVEGDPKIYTHKFEPESVVYYELILDTNALPKDTLVKYEIHFTVKDHTDTIYTIDPYLKLPKQL